MKRKQLVLQRGQDLSLNSLVPCILVILCQGCVRLPSDFRCIFHRVALNGDVLGVSLGTALVHELGHAQGYYSGNFPRYPAGSTDSDAVYYENQHRKLLAVPKYTQRISH